MKTLARTACVVAALTLGACGGSDVSSPAAEPLAPEQQVDEPVADDATPNESTTDGTDGDFNGSEGAPGSIRATAGDIEYEIDGLHCTLTESEFGPAAQFFLNDGNEGHTVFFAFAPIETLTNERLTITGPQGTLHLEHKQLPGGEVMNTQTREPGAFLFDQSAPSLQIDSAVLFTVTSPDATEPVEVAGAITIDCEG